MEKLGRELQDAQSLAFSKTANVFVSFPMEGNNRISLAGLTPWELVDRERGLGRARINKQQYFDNVPLSAWSFSFGDCYPAYEWIKDREGSSLNEEDLKQYQRIVAVLFKTAHFVKEIDKIIPVVQRKKR